uniref:BTB domain-containing protein n=1 Tax=Panagrolaimus sp. ES5 TaxID=591445 RepID=A0AC34FMJ8_9BILA
MSVIPKTKLQGPIAMKWSIPEYRLRQMIYKPGKHLRSSFFKVSNIPGVEYYLSIYPNDDDCLGGTGIYLCLRFTDKIKIEASYNFIIESANYIVKRESVYQKTNGWGVACCTPGELFDLEKRFIFDGKFTIKMDGILTVEKDMPQKAETFVNYHDDLSLELWNQEEDKNFTIAADGKEITVHRCVLATRSPVFTKMFESGLKEAREKKVKIEDFSFDIVEKAIKLCYHHSLVPHTSLDDKMKLLQFFDKYDIQQLKNNLEAYLITVINELTVCRLATCSLLSNSPKLEGKCAKFLQSCFGTKPIADFDLLDRDFALKLLKNAFYPVSEKFCLML